MSLQHCIRAEILDPSSRSGLLAERSDICSANAKPPNGAGDSLPEGNNALIVSALLDSARIEVSYMFPTNIIAIIHGKSFHTSL